VPTVVTNPDLGSDSSTGHARPSVARPQWAGLPAPGSEARGDGWYRGGGMAKARERVLDLACLRA